MLLNHKHKGFTLIELSIVLVIIGLLVGGVIVAQNLMRTARLNSVMADFRAINTATHAFMEKYDCLAGDCPNATSFGFVGNGNGDNRISELTSFPDATESLEKWYFFTHTSAAGFLPGTYSGAAGPVYYRESVPGTNVMASKIAGAGYTVVYWGGYSDVNDFTNQPGRGIRKHAILFGKPDNISTPVVTHETYAPAISPIDALYIDTKLDDGNPGTGQILGSNPSLSLPIEFRGCASSTDGLTATYLSTTDEAKCGLVLAADF